MAEKKRLPEVTPEDVRGPGSPPRQACPKQHRQREGSLHPVRTCLSKLSPRTPMAEEASWPRTRIRLFGFSLGTGAPGAEVTRSCDMAEAGAGLTGGKEKLLRSLVPKTGKRKPATCKVSFGSGTLSAFTCELHLASPNAKA